MGLYLLGPPPRIGTVKAFWNALIYVFAWVVTIITGVRVLDRRQSPVVRSALAETPMASDGKSTPGDQEMRLMRNLAVGVMVLVTPLLSGCAAYMARYEWVTNSPKDTDTAYFAGTAGYAKGFVEFPRHLWNEPKQFWEEGDLLFVLALPLLAVDIPLTLVADLLWIPSDHTRHQLNTLTEKAVQGDVDSQYALGIHHRERAETLTRRGDSQDGHIRYRQHEETEEALVWLNQAAFAGHAMAAEARDQMEQDLDPSIDKLRIRERCAELLDRIDERREAAASAAGQGNPNPAPSAASSSPIAAASEPAPVIDQESAGREPRAGAGMVAMRVPTGCQAKAGTPAEPYTGTGWAQAVVHGQTGVELVYIPSGTFTMGWPTNEPGKSAHEMERPRAMSKGFYMGKHEVTQAQWQKIMDTAPSRFTGGDLPVERVSWDDCQAFCQKTGFRLPSTAEWECACRAGTAGAYGGTGVLDAMGWYYGNSGNQRLDDAQWPYGCEANQNRAHPVGQKQANAWGLYDMHGNVWEWCSSGGSSLYVIRGGSWSSWARDCRAGNLSTKWQGKRNSRVGFRVVLPAGE